MRRWRLGSFRGISGSGSILGFALAGLLVQPWRALRTRAVIQRQYALAGGGWRVLCWLLGCVLTGMGRAGDQYGDDQCE